MNGGVHQLQMSIMLFARVLQKKRTWWGKNRKVKVEIESVRAKIIKLAVLKHTRKGYFWMKLRCGVARVL